MNGNTQKQADRKPDKNWLCTVLDIPSLYLCECLDRGTFTVACARDKQWENVQGRILSCRASRTLCVLPYSVCVAICVICAIQFWYVVQETSAGIWKFCTSKHVWSHQWKKRRNILSQRTIHSVAYVCVLKIKWECSLFNLCPLIPLPLILTEAQELFQCKSIADWRKPHPSPSLYPMIPVIHFFSVPHTSCLIQSHMSGMFTISESLRGVINSRSHDTL